MGWSSKLRDTYIGAWRRDKDYFGEDAFANGTGHSAGPFRCWWMKVVGRSTCKIRGNTGRRLFFSAPKGFR
jgi:hypothetical protein